MRDRMATDRSIFGITVYVEENDAQRLNYYGFAADLWPGHTPRRVSASAGHTVICSAGTAGIRPHFPGHSQNFTLFGAPELEQITMWRWRS